MASASRAVPVSSSTVLRRLLVLDPWRIVASGAREWLQSVRSQEGVKEGVEIRLPAQAPLLASLHDYTGRDAPSGECSAFLVGATLARNFHRKQWKSRTARDVSSTLIHPAVHNRIHLPSVSYQRVGSHACESGCTCIVDLEQEDITNPTSNLSLDWQRTVAHVAQNHPPACAPHPHLRFLSFIGAFELSAPRVTVFLRKEDDLPMDLALCAGDLTHAPGIWNLPHQRSGPETRWEDEPIAKGVVDCMIQAFQNAA